MNLLLKQECSFQLNICVHPDTFTVFSYLKICEKKLIPYSTLPIPKMKINYC